VLGRREVVAMRQRKTQRMKLTPTDLRLLAGQMGWADVVDVTMPLYLYDKLLEAIRAEAGRGFDD
jgi:hypothetical protein